MKINIDIDCSPEEARDVMGLPDLKPLQNAVLTQVETQMLDAVKRLSPEALIKQWASFTSPSSEMMQNLLNSMFGGLASSSKTDTKTTGK